MRGLALVALLLALPAAAAHDPVIDLVDWQQGSFVAPTSPFLPSPLADAFAFDAPECYRRLTIDLLYDPAELELGAEGVGELALAYEFRVEIWRNGTLVLQERVSRSAHNIQLGLLEQAGEHTMRLSLGWGADVEYKMRLRGLFLSNDPACNPPL